MRPKRKTPCKKTSLPVATLFIFIIGFGAGYLYYADTLPAVFSSETKTPKLNVCFSPEGQCEKLVLFSIRKAKKEILVQCILFDRSQLKAPYSQIHNLTKAGIKTKVDYVKGIAHNKVLIIDQERLMSGSYNFSAAANTKNAENMLFINDPNLAMIYKNQWLKRHQQNET